MILNTISNGRGLQLTTLDYGARMVSLLFPDRAERLIDLIAGYDDPERYLSHGIYYGAICGRFANRIRHGRFPLGDRVIQLECNHDGHHLHGGEQGLHAQYWSVAEVRENYIQYEHTSRNGEMGYPGKLELQLTYRLESDESLLISYSAQSDQDTVVNLASHAYFNLDGGNSVLDHELMIDAGHFLPIDEEAIPTGILQAVGHTPFDFQNFKTIGKEVMGNHEQLRNGKGYDHCFALRHPGDLSHKAASLRSTRSGIQMDLYTTQPGLQLYTCNWNEKTDTGKQNRIYRERQFVCLEAEHFPDSPNHPDFPSTALKAGETYSHQTRLNFTRF